MLTTDQKGNIAELAVAAEAAKLGVDIYRPVGEGGRYDMIFDVGTRLLRIQCKWAPRHGDVIVLRCYSCRRNGDGLQRRKYVEGEIDAFVAYCPDTHFLLLPAIRVVQPAVASPAAAGAL
jgi:hypothetical protein